MNGGRIPNPSNPFGIVPLSNFVPRGFGFVHHSIAILYHEVPNPNITIRNCLIAVGNPSRLALLPDSDAKVANREVGISGGRSLTGPSRDARRFPSTRWYPIPRAFTYDVRVRGLSIVQGPRAEPRVTIRNFCIAVCPVSALHSYCNSCESDDQRLE
jgi:hypothetical protein